MEDEIKMAKEGVSLVGELIKAAGDNPEVKAAGSNLGTAALTLSKAINNVLLPLAAVNFAFDKARKYFSEKFPEDMSASASKIPPESLIAPKASIAGPVLQCLTFAHDEPDLKSMYLGLLASSMDARVAGDVHPAFVEIIKQLDSREAKYLENLLAFAGTTYPIVEIRCVTAGQQGWFPIFRHLMRLTDDVSGLPSEDARFPASVDNWIRLGLVDVVYGTYLSGDNQYAWVELQPEYCRLTELHRSENVIVKFERGILRITELGNQFAIAVGLRRAT